MDFTTTFFTVLIALFFIIPGYLLKKWGKVDAEHSKSLSALLIYVFSPAMIIRSFLNSTFTLESGLNLLWFFLFTLFLQILFMLLLFLFLRKKYDDSKYRILTIASAFGNVGFFGMPLIQALLPNSTIALCYSSIFVLSMNILVFTVGIFCITNDKKFMSLKSAILNPSVFAMVIAIPLFVWNIKLPSLLMDAINLLGQMTTPICMLILGIRLANGSLKQVFLSKFTYLICLMKLIVFPLFCYLLVYFLPFDYDFKASILILCSTPCAAIILNLAEIYQSDRKISANAIMISTLLSILTIPILLLIL